MKCVCCGKITSLGGNAGYWQRWGGRHQWVCRQCENSGQYAQKQPDERQMCWRHNLPMRPAGGCIQCEKEGY